MTEIELGLGLMAVGFALIALGLGGPIAAGAALIGFAVGLLLLQVKA